MTIFVVLVVFLALLTLANLILTAAERRRIAGRAESPARRVEAEREQGGVRCSRHEQPSSSAAEEPPVRLQAG